LAKYASFLLVLKWKKASKRFSRTNSKNCKDNLRFRPFQIVRLFRFQFLILLECVKNLTIISICYSMIRKYVLDDCCNKSWEQFKSAKMNKISRRIPYCCILHLELKLLCLLKIKIKKIVQNQTIYNILKMLWHRENLSNSLYQTLKILYSQTMNSSLTHLMIQINKK